MKNINKIKLLITKNSYAAFAAQLLFALVVTSFPIAQTSAVQLQDRKVTMSDSGPSGGAITTGVGSGTKVAYKFDFTTTNTSSTIGGIVIDFCSNSPLAGDSCTAPTGFNSNKATTAIYNQTGLGTGAFAVFTTDSGTGNNNRIIVTRGAAAALTATASFELGNGLAAGNGFTNPSTVGTFYARMYTYATAAAAQAHVTSAATGYIDFGGLAMSTANIITITARVQENLIFCASGAAPTSNCGGTTSPALIIGHGSTVKVIDSSAVDTGVVYTQVSTNAGNGVAVRMRNSNGTCGGLSTDGGTTCSIPPTNGGAATTPTSAPQAITAGTAAFGLAVTAGSGLTTSAPYSGSTASNYYGMDTTTSGSNVTTTYGSVVVTAPGPVSNVNSTWNFAATASNTTAAGIYTANIAVIATGTF